MDLKQHLIRQMAFSHATFGPGERTAGVIDHIRKELIEVEEANGESSEWVDVVILALDGLTRRLAYCNGKRRDPHEVAELACRMIESKQTRNEARDWPDWRTADKDKAIEHIKDIDWDVARIPSIADRDWSTLEARKLWRYLCDLPEPRTPAEAEQRKTAMAAHIAKFYKADDVMDQIRKLFS
jgi:hypothetical protein